ncbi:MAG TPA: hypothetical protein DD399_13230, partial [Alcanivorax sp.]|nr:hypothetical protein [Alcanivorax sp.]
PLVLVLSMPAFAADATLGVNAETGVRVDTSGAEKHLEEQRDGMKRDAEARAEQAREKAAAQRDKAAAQREKAEAKR